MHYEEWMKRHVGGSKKKESDVFEMIVAWGDYQFITINGGLRLNPSKTSQPQFFFFFEF